MESLNLKNLLIQVLDGWVGNTILPTWLRARFLFLLIWLNNNLLGSWLIVNSTQFKAKVGIPIVLREVLEWLAVVMSDGMSKVLVNDILGHVF